MKRIIPIFLLCICLFGSGGIYYGFRIVQYCNYLHVRQLIRSNLIQNELKLMVINKGDRNSIHWKNNHREFEYQGQMYDVARANEVKGNSLIYCYPDVKEKRLIAMFNQRKPWNNQLSKILSKILLANCIIPYERPGIIPVVQDFDYNNYYNFTISFLSDIHSPPPKQVLTS